MELLLTLTAKADEATLKGLPDEADESRMPFSVNKPKVCSYNPVIPTYRSIHRYQICVHHVRFCAGHEEFKTGDKRLCHRLSADSILQPKSSKDETRPRT